MFLGFGWFWGQQLDADTVPGPFAPFASYVLRLSCSRSISGKWKMLWWPGPILVLQFCFASACILQSRKSKAWLEAKCKSILAGGFYRQMFTRNSEGFVSFCSRSIKHLQCQGSLCIMGHRFQASHSVNLKMWKELHGLKSAALNGQAW